MESNVEASMTKHSHFLISMMTLGLGVSMSRPDPAQRTTDWIMPEAYRDVQRTTLATQRDLLMRMIDSIPVAVLRRPVHVGRRDFSQQIHHAATSIADALAQVLRVQPPSWPDTTMTLSSKDGLRSTVELAFGFLDSVLTNQTLDERNAVVSFAGREVHRWQLFDEFNEHTLWTAGQIVGNFRDANLGPPAFKFF